MQNLDYLSILKTLSDLPYAIGKKTLIDIVLGIESKRILANDDFHRLKTYGSLSNYDRELITSWISKLIDHKLITSKKLPQGWKVLSITSDGRKELTNHSLLDNRKEADADPQAEQLIKESGFGLEQYTYEQKLAIVTTKKKVVCIAGAGSGKTSVLTQRIKFLVTFRGVDPSKILAITFTRKARLEMQQRIGGIGVNIMTFNGFCERLLRKHGVQGRIISYGEKISFFREALRKHGISTDAFLAEYFTRSQIANTSRDELRRRLLSDVYTIIDHFANQDTKIPLKNHTSLSTMLLNIANDIQDMMNKKNLRDFSGQLTAALKMLKNHPEKIPSYEHVLIDEYQDVNDAQVKLIELLDPDNLFVVGDPRQSIFGWRGSRISHITSFNEAHRIVLTTNFRCAKKIVDNINKIIEPMQLPPLKAQKTNYGKVKIIPCKTEEEERSLITSIIDSNKHRSLFVIARTNKQLNELGILLQQRKILFSIRQEEDDTVPSGVVLSTAHAIKGLEAELVIVMGVTNRHFPCKVSDHPVIDLIKDFSFDKEEEERRLLYVAMSRAKDDLIITYTGSPSRFLKPLLPKEEQQKTLTIRNDKLYDKLRGWRNKLAASRGLPAYCICTDKTLRELSETMPYTIEDLDNIYGLGSSKIRSYGEEILDVIHAK